jgi:hypothetical protein
MTELASLYYPFSRCVNPASLKQLLLVFDQIPFVDPVDDDQWRMKLFRDLEAHDGQFSQYRAIDSALPDLLDHGCIKRIDPINFVSLDRKLASSSALCDLKDETWLAVASKPRKFRMPSIDIRGKPSWQIFLPKLPEDFLHALMDSPEFQEHLLVEGDARTSWSLSYAAGSAIGIALHLEIAEAVGAAPVTDSELHHRLLLMKLARATEKIDKSIPLPDDAIRYLTSDIASTMLSQVLPEGRLREVSFEEILSFRSNTTALRRQFISDIESRLGQLRTVPDAQEWVVVGRQVLANLQTDLQRYQTEFTANRDKVWPGIASSLNSAFVSGSVGAVAMSFIGGPGKALLGSIAGASIGVLKTALDFYAERKKLVNSSAPSMAYLSRVSSQVG